MEPQKDKGRQRGTEPARDGAPATGASPRKDTRGWVGVLLSYAGRCRGKMIVSELCSIASVASGLVPFYALYRVIDLVVEGDSGQGIAFWLAVAAGAYVCRHVLFGCSTVLSHISAYTILASLRQNMADKLMRASLGTASSKSAGALKNLYVDRIESIEVPLAHMIPELSANVLLAVAIAAWMIAIDWRLALAALFTLPLGGLVFAGSLGAYNRMYAGYRAECDRVNSVMVEYIEGIRVVKAFNQASESYRKYADAVKSFRDYTLGWFKATWGTQNLALSIIPTTLLGVVPAGIALYLAGELAPAEFALACMLALAVVMPLTYVGASFNVANNISYAIADAREFLDLPELPQPAVSAPTRGSSVVFDHVRFSYVAGEEVIHDVSIEVPENSFLALVGPSGSGKSTLARLIARHWDVDGGAVRIGGTDVRDLSLDALSDLVSYVSQDDYLIDGTLYKNVACGRPQASSEDIMAAARAASCDEFVSKLEHGWDTSAGEAGHALSGGERQRICIARAVLKDAPIVVFDEATAFADPENEARIQRSIAQMAQGKTLIVIAHRLSTITAADSIVVMEAGRVAAQGTHEELLATCPLYASMWDAHIGSARWAAGSHGGAASGAALEARGSEGRCVR